MPTPRTPKRRLSYANVTATLALVIATSMGGAYAHGKISSADIEKNAVKSRHIAPKNVKTSDLAKKAVSASRIKPKAVKPKHISDHAMWALIAPDGTLIQGRGVTAVAHPSTGFFVVTFSKSVTNRALTATLYNDGAGDGQINVRNCDPDHPAFISCFATNGANRAMVNTENSGGINADGTFYVVAMPLTPGTVTAAPRVIPRAQGGAEGR